MAEPIGGTATQAVQNVPTEADARLNEREITVEQTLGTFYDLILSGIMKTVEESNVTLEDETCYICLNDYYSWNGSARICDDVPMRLNQCGHIFGLACIKEWLAPDTGKNTCPMCRVILFPQTFPAPPRQFDQASGASILSSSLTVSTGPGESEARSESSQSSGSELIRVDTVRLLGALRDSMQWAVLRADLPGVNCDLHTVTRDLQAAAMRFQVLRTIIARREFPPNSAVGGLRRNKVMQRHYGKYITQRRSEEQQESEPERGFRGRLRRMIKRTKQRFGRDKGRWPSLEMKDLVEEIVAQMVSSQRTL